MIRDVLILFAGLAAAAAGGELFLRGTVGVAQGWRLSPALVGAVIAACATSSPELSVSVGSALAGTPEIALGDALGSNVVNIALVLGVALLFGPLRCSREALRRDLVAACAAPVLLAVLAWDGWLTRGDGAVLLAAFGLWLVSAVRAARRQRSAVEETEPAAGAPWRSTGLLLLGLALLIAAARGIVTGAQGIALALGWPAYLVGAVIVAAGTSTPEVVTTLFARWRGHDAIGLGTLLGSNVFNLCFIVAVAALIHPIQFAGRGPWVALGFGMAAVALAYPGPDGVLSRARALILLAIYAGYLLVTLGWR